ncbi:PAS domain-containing protein [Aureimonas sp. SK2]|uniref:PAS domain-containing sensor histidine kinase n=1 Tax=Aureimonas sp. SK2 TaxID=3015992 RepID=UPI002444D829|nr:PAS domain-containing protein [Aureimonas sp. SK2]
MTLENERLRSPDTPAPEEGSTAALPLAVYETLTANVADYALVATDLLGRITLWNKAAADVFGWPQDRMIGRPIADLFTPEDRAAGLAEEEMATATREGRATDNRWLLRRDGETFFARGELVPLRDAGGRQIGFLKILRDRTDEEVSRLELAASRERLQFALDASALVGTWDWILPDDIIYADARFAALYGVDEALAASGLPIETYLHGIHPEDRAHAGAAIQEALATGGDFSADYRTIGSDGTVRWLHARGRCFLNDAGRPVRFPGAVVDVTRDKLRERRQDALLRLGDEGGFGEAIDYTLKALNLLGETLEIGRVGYATVDPTETYATILGEWTAPGLTPLTGRKRIGDFGSSLVKALQAGMTVVEDVRTDPITRDGAAAWEAIGSLSMINLVVREGSRLQVILYLHHTAPRVWTEDEIGFIREVLNRAWTYSRRRLAERSLIEAETRLRLAHEAAEMGSFDYDLQTGEMVCDARCRAIFGIGDEATVTYSGTLRPQIHPEDRERVEAAARKAMEPDSDGSFDLVFRTVGGDDGGSRVVHANGRCVSSDGVPVRIVCAVRDVTDAKEAEERQTLLTRELQHRVKNTLAMVNALANQTLRRAATAQEGLAAFSARLMALSHAHDILTQTSWTSAPIEAIVSQALATHGGEDERIAWSGPDLRLTARQSLALALALHELATNAAKYGALSNETGQVRIGWQVARGEGCETIRFEWRESGGPPVVAPERKGFGSRLIEQSLAAEFGGEVVVTYDPAGLVCTIEADLQLDPEDSVLPSGLGDA